MMQRELILASTSKYRREQLTKLGVPFGCKDPAVDEEKFKALGLPPSELAQRLAFEKANAVAAASPTAVVIGSDQLVSFEGEVLGKPGDAMGAKKQLERLAGRVHELITCVAIVADGKVITHAELAQLTMRELTKDEIARYVDRENPIDCAGSYKLEEQGIALFESVDCRDHSAIIGLPLIAVTSALRNLGFAIP